MYRVPAAAVALLLAAPAWSQMTADQIRTHLTLDESSIKITRLGPSLHQTDIPAPLKVPGGDGVIPVLDDIINIGTKIWKIVEDGKPVVDVKTQYATALPKGITNWGDMAGWQPPVGTVYELTAQNGFHDTVIDLRYQVLRTYGGNYDGKGKYLTAVTVEPLYWNVAWGYTFGVDATIPDTSIVNVGTSADPVAGMLVQLGWRISTPIKASSGQSVYFVQGDGVFREIGGPFANKSLEKAASAAAAAAGGAPRFD
jgi:hypothetical protein